MKAIIAPCHAYGDDVDTDRIIAGKYTKTLNPADLAARVLEDLDPDFRRRMQAGDILVGGENFGCGSSREQAPLALQAIKRTALETHTQPWAEAFRFEMEQAGAVMMSEDAREGPRAFREKRDPEFRGR